MDFKAIHVLYISILVIYALTLIFILVYSIFQSILLIMYVRWSKKKTEILPDIDFLDRADLPTVLIQLPVFNELYVVERLLDSVSKMIYPKEKLYIQLLDDSTDESFAVAAKKCESLKKEGFQIVHIKRPNREGYKAGALKYGMGMTDADLIAIFDADFIPEKTFLLSTIPCFDDPSIGLVQTRWGHINKNYSILTRAQSMLLDAHFTIEQAGRNSGGLFIQFNGTAGVWRKKTIEDAGGWHADTLTEDLDLSYRAQLRGWKVKYMKNTISPAELPIVMSAFKSQQFRWMKGGAQNVKKYFSLIANTPQKIKIKMHCYAQLMAGSVFIAVFLSGFLTLPVLYVKNNYPESHIFFSFLSVFIFSPIVLVFYCWYSVSEQSGFKKISYFANHFLSFITITVGLSYHNSIAVLDGYFGKDSPFVRTPKFNLKKQKNWTSNKYLIQMDKTILIEVLLFFYYALGIVLSIIYQDFSFIPVLLLQVLGYGLISCYSISHAIKY